MSQVILKIQAVALVGLVTILLTHSSLSSSVPSSRDSREDESCHLREFDLCMAPLAVVAQAQNSHPINNAEINRQCKLLLETESCLSNFTNRCMTENQGKLVSLMSDNGLDTIRELCKPRSETRDKYLKHGNCINDQYKGQKLCIRDFQAALEKANDISWQDRLKLVCCGFNKMNACNRDVIEPKCGSEAYEMHRKLFRTAFSRLPSITCSKYEHNSKVCGSLLPAAGTIPKGAKSHSVLSRMMSTYTGN